MLHLPMRDKLIEALRGDRYAQGREFMRSLDDRWCLYGVALDLAGVRWHREAVAYNTNFEEREAIAEREKLWPLIDHISRAEKTDGRELSFLECADWIEHNTVADHGV